MLTDRKSIAHALFKAYSKGFEHGVRSLTNATKSPELEDELVEMMDSLFGDESESNEPNE